MKSFLRSSICVVFLLLSVVQSKAIEVTLINNGNSSGSPYPGTSTERDTLNVAFPKPLKMRQDTECDITCDVTGRQLTLVSKQCFNDVQILIYGFPAGVKYSSEINLTDNETFSIPVDYPSGIYTIRLTLSDGTVLEGHFELE